MGNRPRDKKRAGNFTPRHLMGILNMFTSACVAFLLGVSPVENSVPMEVRFKPHRLYVGDVAFGIAGIANRSGRPYPDFPVRELSATSTATVSFGSLAGPYRFQSVHLDTAHGWVGPRRLTMEPGEHWTAGFPMLFVGDPKRFDHNLWGDQSFSQPCQTSVFYRFPSGTELKGGNTIFITLRPKAEMEFLTRLFQDSAALDDKVQDPSRFDPHLPRPSDFGLSALSVDEEIVGRLLSYEQQLSPGTLRDIAKLTRLMRIIHSPESPQTRNATFTELLQWLDTLPEIQRQAIATRLGRYVYNNPKISPKTNPDSAGFLRGVIQRMPEEAFGSTAVRDEHLRACGLVEVDEDEKNAESSRLHQE